MNQEIVQSVENMILTQLRKSQSFTDPSNQFTIKVADVSENGELLFLEFQHKEGNCRVRAEKGKLEFKKSNDGKSILSIALVNAEIENTEKQIKSIWAGEKQMELPLQDVFHKKDRVQYLSKLPQKSLLLRVSNEVETDQHNDGSCECHNLMTNV